MIVIGLVCRHFSRGIFGVDPASTSIYYCKIWYFLIYTMSTWSSWILICKYAGKYAEKNAGKYVKYVKNRGTTIHVQ